MNHLKTAARTGAAVALAFCLIGLTGLIGAGPNTAQASNGYYNCSDADGSYEFYEDSETQGMLSPRYEGANESETILADIVDRTVLASAEERCTTAGGDTYFTFFELTSLLVRPVDPDDRISPDWIYLLCETAGDSYPFDEDADTTCVSKQETRSAIIGTPVEWDADSKGQ